MLGAAGMDHCEAFLSYEVKCWLCLSSSLREAASWRGIPSSSLLSLLLWSFLELFPVFGTYCVIPLISLSHCIPLHNLLWPSSFIPWSPSLLLPPPPSPYPHHVVFCSSVIPLFSLSHRISLRNLIWTSSFTLWSPSPLPPPPSPFPYTVIVILFTCMQFLLTSSWWKTMSCCLLILQVPVQWAGLSGEESHQLMGGTSYWQHRSQVQVILWFPCLVHITCYI